VTLTAGGYQRNICRSALADASRIGHSALHRVVRIHPDRARLMDVRDAEVRYAERDGNYLAFMVFGDGPVDLLVTSRYPIDLVWEFPPLTDFMVALGGMARVIACDGSGSGASDPFAGDAGSAVEYWGDDVLAVLDAADCERATLFDLGENGYGSMTAATYPDRVQSLIFGNLRASFPELRRLSADQRRGLVMKLRHPDRLRLENPRVAHDPVVRRWWEHAVRLRSSPTEQIRNMEIACHVDISPLLPTVRTPTLVLHRRDNRVWDIESSRAAASLMPNARFVELPGAEVDLFLGDTAPALTEIQRFLAEPTTDFAHDRILATVLFTDIVSSTEQLAARGDAAWRRVLDDHDRIMDRIVADYRGRVVKGTGDGILATFDGPARAVRCAQALLDAAKSQGVTLRAGLHTGEIEVRPSDLAGIAVHIANRITTAADPSEILVSRTVVDLTAGSGLQFDPRGEHELKGVPGTWPTFAAQTSS
jgi:class 3 adenylate cyclase